MTDAVLQVEALSKTFTMHLQDALQLPVMVEASFAVHPGECVVLGGPSGAGKSSLLKMVAATYRASSGRILLRHRGEIVDIVQADERTLIDIRRTTMANVTQFLRSIPRVSAFDIVTDAAGGDSARAATLLRRLNLPERLWALPPATFSGGEKQRLNIACGFVRDAALLLVDEPTASLDAANRAVVIDMILEKKAEGRAILGIFHDSEVRDVVADRVVDVMAFAPRVAA